MNDFHFESTLKLFTDTFRNLDKVGSCSLETRLRSQGRNQSMMTDGVSQTCGLNLSVLL